MINKPLRELAQAKNFYLGAAVLPNLLKKDSKYAARGKSTPFSFVFWKTNC